MLSISYLCKTSSVSKSGYYKYLCDCGVILNKKKKDDEKIATNNSHDDYVLKFLTLGTH